MGILDDPARYYAPPGDDWSLGDIVIVPTAVLRTATERPLTPFLQPAPPPDGSASVFYPLWHPLGPMPQPAIEASLSPAMIVADDCVLDNEFNAYVERRTRAGVSEDVAVEEARTDQSLDPLVPVAPILPYLTLRSANAQSVRTAQAIGYFPIVPSPDPTLEACSILGFSEPVGRFRDHGRVPSWSPMTIGPKVASRPEGRDPAVVLVLFSINATHAKP